MEDCRFDPPDGDREDRLLVVLKSFTVPSFVGIVRPFFVLLSLKCWRPYAAEDHQMAGHE